VASRIVEYILWYVHERSDVNDKIKFSKREIFNPYK